MSDDLSGFSMMELFQAEVESHGTVLGEGLVELESRPTDPTLLESLMRAAHSIKGAARIVGVDAAVQVAHAMEDCLVAAQEGRLVLDASAVDALLECADLLRMIGSLVADDAPAWFAANADAIAAAVERVRKAGGGSALPAPAAPASPPEPAGEPVDSAEGEPEPETETGGEASSAAASEPPVAPRPAPDPAASGPRSAAPAQAVRVSAAGLTRMLALAGESVVAARRLSGIARSLGQVRDEAQRLQMALERLGEQDRAYEDAALDEQLKVLQSEVHQLRGLLHQRMGVVDLAARRGGEVAERLYREVLRSRMRPFSEGVGAFTRLVRDLARELGKKVRFEIRGREVEVDRDILDQLEAPLNHMIRNSLDHGLETPAEREAAGKPEQGALTLEARHRAGMLEIDLRDDGRGVDPEALRQRIVARDLIPEEMARSLSTPELMEFMFLPGFSTKSEVSEISGRGVGLDVVHSMAREAGGVVRAESEPGKGIRFLLTLPITRSVIRAALVEIAGQPYAFPLPHVERLLQVEHEDLHDVEGRQRFVYEDADVGLVPAAEVLGLGETSPQADGVAVVLLASGSDRYGLAVTSFLGEEDLVVRPLDPRLGEVPNISAAALDEEGRPVLIVDVQDLVRSVDLLLHEGRLRSIHLARERAADARRRKRVLVVDDSITVREVERNLLVHRGFDVDVAVDGNEGWNAVRSGDYDLVVTDVDMPRMDGIELVRRIKQDARLAVIPVMIVSYKDREEDRMRGLEAGASAYLTKSSFHDETWIATVVDLIGEPEE